MKSMTGYGQASAEDQHFKVTVEMKSFNHRFSEIMIRMPRQYLSVEDQLKKTIGVYVKRGKLDVYITIEGRGLVNKKLEVDWDLMQQYIEAGKEAQQRFELKDNVTIKSLLLDEAISSIYEQENEADIVYPLLIETTERAAKQLADMRWQEGLLLYKDMKQRVDKVEGMTKKLFAYAPGVAQQYEQRLRKRVSEFLSGKVAIDEGRLLNEVAIFADKANIEEELTRLTSHANQFVEVINDGDVVGRKLDFLVQEMNREVNTIGSKANDLHINQQVIELKSEIEKIKEQVQNVE